MLTFGLDRNTKATVNPILSKRPSREAGKAFWRERDGATMGTASQTPEPVGAGNV